MTLSGGTPIGDLPGRDTPSAVGPRSGIRLGAHLLVAAVSGFCVMVLEFAAVRLLAPFFGQSNQVWANVIGAILLALSLGYWAGGHLGARSRSARPLYVGYGLCAGWTVLVAFLGTAVCEALTPSGFGVQRTLPLGFTGSLISAFVLFCPPVFLLGMTSPFLIQMETRHGHEGRTTGGIYAMGTLGSLLGCYLAPLEMLQVYGTRSTFLIAATLLGVLALVGLWCTRREGRDVVAASPEEAPARVRSKVETWLITVAALTGFAVTVIEFAAVRFMAPWFGQSNYVWANVIGVILLALALGSWVGGRWADIALAKGTAGGRALYVALSIGALLIVVVCLVGPGFMEVLIPQAVGGYPIDSMHVLPIAVRGSLVATVLFFGPALLLLGMVPPFLVRMGSEGQGAGRTAGILLAWTTMGGLLGCFVTAPLLVPWLGSRGTLLLAALGIALIACVALRRQGRPAFATSLGAALCALGYLLYAVGSDAPLRSQPGQLAEVESAYQVIRVVRSKVNLLIPQTTLGQAPGDLHVGGQETDTIFLRHDEDAETYQSSLLVDPGLSLQWLTGGRYFEHMALGAFFARPQAPQRQGEGVPAVGPPLRVLIVGYAGGTVHRTLRDTLGPDANYHVLGVEIDPAVIDVARTYLRHRELEGDHLELVLGEDARTVVNALPADRQFDLVLIDAYTRTNYVPFQLASREFFQRVEKHLAPGAWVGVNVLGTGLRSPVADAVANTMGSVFGRAFVAPNPAFLGNVILWASPGALRGPRISSRARLHPGLQTAAFALERLLVLHDATAGSGLILTDDLSPSDKLADIELGLYGRAAK